MSAAKRKPEWGKTGVIAAYAEWLRKSSGALAVIVVRRDDAVLAADRDLMPRDIEPLLEDRLPGLAKDLRLSREERRPAARQALGELRE